jgi:hypothetical protein
MEAEEAIAPAKAAFPARSAKPGRKVMVSGWPFYYR